MISRRDLGSSCGASPSITITIRSAARRDLVIPGPSFTGAAFADAPHSATLDAMAIAIALIPFAPGFADAGASGMTRSRRAADRIVIVMDGRAPHELPRSRRDIISCGGDYMPGRS